MSYLETLAFGVFVTAVTIIAIAGIVVCFEEGTGHSISQTRVGIGSACLGGVVIGVCAAIGAVELLRGIFA